RLVEGAVAEGQVLRVADHEVDVPARLALPHEVGEHVPRRLQVVARKVEPYHAHRIARRLERVTPVAAAQVEHALARGQMEVAAEVDVDDVVRHRRLRGGWRSRALPPAGGPRQRPGERL